MFLGELSAQKSTSGTKVRGFLDIILAKSW